MAPRKKRTPDPDEPRVDVVCSMTGQIINAKLGARGPVKPQGWKKLPDGRWLGSDFLQNYRLQAVKFVLAGPFGETTWDDLRQALKATFKLTTEAATWAQRTLELAEPVRQPQHTKFWPPPSVYLYGLAKQQEVAQALPSQSRQAIFRVVTKRWHACRFQSLWLRSTRPPFYQYPYPLPVPSQGWSVAYGPNRQMLFSCRIGDRRCTLRLRGGPQFQREKMFFDHLIQKTAFPAEAVISEETSFRGGQNRLTEKAPGGGQSVPKTVTVRLVGYFPIHRRDVRDRSGSLLVRTARESFLVATVAGDESRPPWVLNGDHVRRKIVDHRRKLTRLAEDQKAERRRPKRARLPLNEYRALLCDRQRKSVQKWLEESAAWLAAYAARCRVAEVVLDATDRRWAEGEFPWYAWTAQLKRKLRDEYGLELRDVTAADAQPSEESEDAADVGGTGG